MPYSDTARMFFSHGTFSRTHKICSISEESLGRTLFWTLPTPQLRHFKQSELLLALLRPTATYCNIVWRSEGFGTRGSGPVHGFKRMLRTN